MYTQALQTATVMETWSYEEYMEETRHTSGETDVIAGNPNKQIKDVNCVDSYLILRQSSVVSAA